MLKDVSNELSMGCSVIESAPSLRGKSDIDNIGVCVRAGGEVVFSYNGNILPISFISILLLLEDAQTYYLWSQAFPVDY